MSSCKKEILRYYSKANITTVSSFLTTDETITDIRVLTVFNETSQPIVVGYKSQSAFICNAVVPPGKVFTRISNETILGNSIEIKSLGNNPLSSEFVYINIGN